MSTVAFSGVVNKAVTTAVSSAFVDEIHKGSTPAVKVSCERATVSFQAIALLVMLSERLTEPSV